MSKTIKIRRNNITNNWEHWVFYPGSQSDGYWADGVYGSDEKNMELLKDTSNIDQLGNVIFYEEFNNKREQVELAIKTYNLNDLNNFDDTKIWELLDPSIAGQGIPVVTDIYDTNLHSIINSKNEINNVYYDAQLQLSVSASSSDTKTPLNYYWILDGTQGNVDTKNLYKIDFSNDIFVTPTKSKSILCKVENTAGSTLSNNLGLTVYNARLSNIFGNNLIKNGFGKDGLQNWTVTKGDPKTYPVYEEFKKIGFFEASIFPDINSFNPTLPEKTDLFYFMGGETTPDNAISSMYQIIDVSDAAAYIDGTVYGSNAVQANISGLFGKWGTSGRWKQTTTPPVRYDDPDVGYIPQISWIEEDQKYPLAFYRYYGSDSFQSMCTMDYCIGDKSKMVVTFLDEMDNKLGNEVILRTDDFSVVARKIWIRSVNVNLPVKTRKLKIEIIFEKDFDIHVDDYIGGTDTTDYVISELKPLVPKILYNTRAWENPSFHYDYIRSQGTLTFHLDHLSMVTALSCQLGLVEKLPTDSSMYNHRREEKLIGRPVHVATYYPDRELSADDGLPVAKIYFHKKEWSGYEPSKFANCGQNKVPELWAEGKQYSEKSADSTGWCITSYGSIFKALKPHISDSSNSPWSSNANTFWEFCLFDYVAFVQQQSTLLLDGYTKGNGIYDQGFPNEITQLIPNATNCPIDKFYKVSCT